MPFFIPSFFLAADKTLRTNYWNFKRVCEILFPILKKGARVVNLTSSVGWLPKVNFPNPTMKTTLARPDLTDEILDDIIRQCTKALKSSSLQQDGFMDPSYTISKVGICALSR